MRNNSQSSGHRTSIENVGNWSVNIQVGSFIDKEKGIYTSLKRNWGVKSWKWHWSQPFWFFQSGAHTAPYCRGISLIWGNPLFKNSPTLKSPSKQWIWDLIDPVIKSPYVWAICLPAFLAVLVILQKLLNLLLPSQQIIDRVKDVCWLSITL